MEMAADDGNDGRETKMATENSDDGGEERTWQEDEGKKTEKKKLRKWRMPQDQIDRILSWEPPVRPRCAVSIDDLQVGEELKEMLRRSDDGWEDAMRGITRYWRGEQDWVKGELATKGYVECEIDDDNNPCCCGCAYAGHGGEEEEEEEESEEGSEYGEEGGEEVSGNDDEDEREAEEGPTEEKRATD